MNDTEEKKKEVPEHCVTWRHLDKVMEEMRANVPQGRHVWKVR